MAQIQANVDLKPFNTFGVSAVAENFGHFISPDDLEKSPPSLVLGTGANVLFTKNISGLTAKMEILGCRLLFQNDEEVRLEVGAGENWHQLVMFAVEQGWSGIENLAYIPGTVGAAPVQNVAAYGQNFGEVVESVSGWDLQLKKYRTLKKDECQFHYRDSLFKHDLKNKFIITQVTISLSKTAHFDTNYHSRFESLASELVKISPPPYSPKQVAEAVIAIRQKKLPDIAKMGSAGSFFKNPFVSRDKLQDLQKEIADLQAYPVNAMLYPNPDDPVFKIYDQVKIPAGRLLDELGWRGKRIGQVGTFERHALVLVNYGGATGEEILDFSKQMQEDIKKHFDIDLEVEVEII